MPVPIDIFEVLLVVEFDARVLHLSEQRNFLIDLIDEESPAVSQDFTFVFEITRLRPDVPLLL